MRGGWLARKRSKRGRRVVEAGFEKVQGHGRHNPKALGAELIERVVRGVPSGIIEVDQVETGDSRNALEWDVIIKDWAIIHPEEGSEGKGIR